MSIRSTIRAIMTMGRGVTRGIAELTAGPDPIAFFNTWFREARESGLFLPEAMTLATVDPDGAPSARMILLKDADTDGFVFYTNYGSRKSQSIAHDDRVALLFHWAVLERQVRVEGRAERVSPEESEAYFRSRPRGSRIGAWASRQSEPLETREVLESEVHAIAKRYDGREIPCPDFWGGFRVRPERIEFWQGRADRLHDRLLYERLDQGWRTSRLYP